MNAVIVAVGIMLILSLVRVHVVVSLIIGAVAGGLVGGLDIKQTLEAFHNGLGNGAKIALSYAILGAFAVAISKSGIADILANRILRMVGKQGAKGESAVKWVLISMLLAAAIASQNILPIHIAFIPLIVPPLVGVMTRLQLDRRLVACVLTFGLVTTYMFLPVGFGAIFLNELVVPNAAKSGLDIVGLNVMNAMLIPSIGMVIGLLIAVFFTYRKKRNYQTIAEPNVDAVGQTQFNVNVWVLIAAGIAVAIAFIVQLTLDSMIMGALSGFVFFSVSGVVRWREAEDLFTQGMKMMAMIGFIMIAAAGFASVIEATGEVKTLVAASVELIGGSKAVGAFVMLLVGLLVTMGIGSSFSTIPIIAVIFVPMAMQLGFSPLAVLSIVGTAGALGDAGSPASDSTLGPTSGLNIDGQHDHIWDTVVPTFIHYNIPLVIFGWIAAMVL